MNGLGKKKHDGRYHPTWPPPKTSHTRIRRSLLLGVARDAVVNRLQRDRSGGPQQFLHVSGILHSRVKELQRRGVVRGDREQFRLRLRRSRHRRRRSAPAALVPLRALLGTQAFEQLGT